MNSEEKPQDMKKRRSFPWKWVMLCIMLAAAAILFAAYYYFVTFDFNRLKPVIESTVSDLTGREMKIRGDIDVVFDMTPSLSLHDVLLSNAAWGSRPDTVVIDRIECDISLAALLDGKVALTRIILTKPDILIERNAERVWNCALFQPIKKKPEPEGKWKRYIDDVSGYFSLRIEAVSYTHLRAHET